MFRSIGSITQLIRVKQWPKNLLVAAAPFASGVLPTADEVSNIFYGVLSFIATSSIVYIVNDWKDQKFDRNHTNKKFRPIAAGTVSEKQIYLILVFLSLILILNLVQLNFKFLIIIFLYLTLNLLYSFKLKEIEIIDCACSIKNLEIIIASIPRTVQRLFFRQLGNIGVFDKILVLLLNCTVQDVEVRHFMLPKSLSNKSFEIYLDAYQ
jgi:hypothetical protein